MVNVGGRSRGCSQCRRRRVKCDETRPICLRCQRSSLECDGPRETAFVTGTIVLSRRKIGQSRSTSPPDGHKQEAGPSNNMELVTPSAPLLGDPQELFIMFTRQHLSAEGPVDVALRQLQASNTTSLASTRIVDPRTTQLQTVLSFATIFFGIKHGDPDITNKGYASHGATLQRLNRALSQPDCHLYDELVVSVTTLAMQEMLVPSGPKQYLSHMLGLEKLLALRDTTLDCSKQTIHLYKCLRYLMLFASLVAGTSSILAKPEWKALLRRYCHNEEEVEEQQLYDALADCSVLMAELNMLLKSCESQGEDHQAHIDSIRRRAQDICHQLQTWRERWDTSPRNAHTEEPMATAPSNNAVQFPKRNSLVFGNMAAALTLMLYDTALIYTLHILTSLPLDPQAPSVTMYYVARAHSAVLEICRTFPDPSDERLHADVYTAPALHWALRAGLMILQNDMTAEGAWLADLLTQKSAVISARDVWKT